MALAVGFGLAEADRDRFCHPRRRPGSGIPSPPARPMPGAAPASAGYAWSQCPIRNDRARTGMSDRYAEQRGDGPAADRRDRSRHRAFREVPAQEVQRRLAANGVNTGAELDRLTGALPGSRAVAALGAAAAAGPGAVWRPCQARRRGWGVDPGYGRPELAAVRDSRHCRCSNRRSPSSRPPQDPEFLAGGQGVDQARPPYGAAGADGLGPPDCRRRGSRLIRSGRKARDRPDGRRPLPATPRPGGTRPDGRSRRPGREAGPGK